MKAKGYIFPVQFSVIRANDPDQRPEILGLVRDSGRGKIFGWIAKMNEVSASALMKYFPQLELRADAGKSIDVVGESKVIDPHAVHPIIYHCGPMHSVFTPEKQKTYLVEFLILGEGCEQHVYDISQPNQRIPIEPEKAEVRPV